jgi:hypothetical protein
MMLALRAHKVFLERQTGPRQALLDIFISPLQSLGVHQPRAVGAFDICGRREQTPFTNHVQSMQKVLNLWKIITPPQRAFGENFRTRDSSTPTP